MPITSARETLLHIFSGPHNHELNLKNHNLFRSIRQAAILIQLNRRQLCIQKLFPFMHLWSLVYFLPYKLSGRQSLCLDFCRLNQWKKSSRHKLKKFVIVFQPINVRKTSVHYCLFIILPRNGVKKSVIKLNTGLFEHDNKSVSFHQMFHLS